MDIFYYSNYCKHSQKVLQFLVKTNLVDSINFLCIDKRVFDKKTNQTKIALENGTQVILPPNLHSVPALLIVSKNYQLILGDDIMEHYKPRIREKIIHANLSGEPDGFALNQFTSSSSNIISEKFTSYNMSPEELSAKSTSTTRPLYNYVGIDNINQFISTPPDTYVPDKLKNISIENLEKQRNSEVELPPLFIPSL